MSENFYFFYCSKGKQIILPSQNDDQTFFDK